MASRRPIVASDLPSLREVLRDGENAILVEPDNPKALAEGIKKVLDDPDLARRISKQAYDEIGKYSWNERAKRIVNFLKERGTR
jgi:glycosyltransferase involved in cell wall biosynthesis